MPRFALAILVGVAVSGCASGGFDSGYGGYGRDSRATPPVTIGPAPGPPADPLARSATYACEDLTTVVLTEGHPMAQVTFNSGLVVNLARQPDVGGFRYGGPQYEFRGRGGDATLFANNRVWRCRAR